MQLNDKLKAVWTIPSTVRRLGRSDAEILAAEAPLVVEPQGKLQFPRLIVLATHDAKRGVGVAAADRVRIAELNPIEEVEDLGAEL
jgi:hypothetical protein